MFNMLYTNNQILYSIVYVHIHVYIYIYNCIDILYIPYTSARPAVRSISGAPAQGGGRGAGGAQGQV